MQRRTTNKTREPEDLFECVVENQTVVDADTQDQEDRDAARDKSV
jgi:hypothetical protein